MSLFSLLCHCNKVTYKLEHKTNYIRFRGKRGKVNEQIILKPIKIALYIRLLYECVMCVSKQEVVNFIFCVWIILIICLYILVELARF